MVPVFDVGAPPGNRLVKGAHSSAAELVHPSTVVTADSDVPAGYVVYSELTGVPSLFSPGDPTDRCRRWSSCPS
jgi:hypothetical protein